MCRLDKRNYNYDIMIWQCDCYEIHYVCLHYVCLYLCWDAPRLFVPASCVRPWGGTVTIGDTRSILEQ